MKKEVKFAVDLPSKITVCVSCVTGGKVHPLESAFGGGILAAVLQYVASNLAFSRLGCHKNEKGAFRIAGARL